ncbi:putative zinc-finger of a C2HC-type [Trypanosoma cruzi]|nr:putative zinc-finger of a C2HC-type [Trypanosoma cruzi]
MPPRFRICPICQQGFGTASLPIHIPQCYEKALKRWRLNPVGPMPVMPSLEPASSRGRRTSTGSSACDNGVTDARPLRRQEGFAGAPEYSEGNMNLHPCSRCGRRFLFDRIAYHESVCKGNVKRKVFDSSKQRTVADDDGGIGGGFGYSHGKKGKRSKSLTGGFPASGGIPKTRWREQHREFMEAIRAARGAAGASRAMWGGTVAKSQRVPAESRQRAPPAVVRHQKGMQMRQQRTMQPIEVPNFRQPLAGRRAPPRRSHGSAFGGGGERFAGGGGLGGGGGKIINDNTTSLGMLQAFGRA